MCLVAVRLLAVEVGCLPMKQVPLGNGAALEQQGVAEGTCERTAIGSEESRVIALLSSDAEHLAE